MRNRILLKLALFLLRRVDIKKVQYPNSFRHYIGEINQFYTDTKT